MTQTRFGTFDDLLKEASLDVSAVAQRLREIVFADLPEAIETVRLGDGAATYGPGPKKMSESHVYIMPKDRYVNLGFFHGSSLKDADKLLEGTGKKMRHVKVRSLKEAENPALRKLVLEALAERKAALGLA